MSFISIYVVFPCAAKYKFPKKKFYMNKYQLYFRDINVYVPMCQFLGTKVYCKYRALPSLGEDVILHRKRCVFDEHSCVILMCCSRNWEWKGHRLVMSVCLKIFVLYATLLFDVSDTTGLYAVNSQHICKCKFL